MEYEYPHDSTHSYVDNSIKEFQYNLPLKHAIKIVAEIFSRYDDSREDQEAQLQEISTFVQSILDNDILPGDADDWHNLAVDIARKDYFDLACNILDTSLRFFPNNPDLLGDYLQYGTSCGRIKQCERYYQQLRRMPTVKYSWRSFHFSASWLIYCWEQCDIAEELDLIIKELQHLVMEYRRHFPNSEESYLCEANIYRLTKNTKKEIKTLAAPIARPIPAPKCALRLADYYFEVGNYELSLEMVQRSLRDSNQVQQTVNEAYLYYLSGLARLALLQNSNAPVLQESIESIYKDFESSLRLGIHSSMRESLCKKGSVIYHRYNVAVPAQCSRLYELLDDRDLLE